MARSQRSFRDGVADTKTGGSGRAASIADRTCRLLLGPEIALRDLKKVAGGIVEVAGAHAAVPRDLVDQRDASIGQALLPRLVLAGRCEECRVDRSGGAVRRRLVLRRRSLSVEQQHDALPEPEREAPSSEAKRLEAEHVLVEPLHLVLLTGCVVQNGLEHAGEPEMFGHDANVLVLTWRRQRTWSELRAPFVIRLNRDNQCPAPRRQENCNARG